MNDKKVIVGVKDESTNTPSGNMAAMFSASVVSRMFLFTEEKAKPWGRCSGGRCAGFPQILSLREVGCL